MQIDLHVHSNVSFDSKIKIGLLLRDLKNIGLDGIAITDHDSIEAIPKAKDIAKKYNVKVFSAVEITAREGHIIAYGISEQPPYRKSVEDTIDWIHDRDGIAVCAHPFRLTAPSLGEKVYLHRFDGLEINARCTMSQNRAAELAARLMNLPLLGGSDAHFIQNIGSISTFFYDELLNEDDLIQAIKHGNCEVRYRISISYKAELIPAIPEEELGLLDKFIETKKEPLLPIIEAKNIKVQFIDKPSNE
ncbi:MAG: PHP domain-containing protein [Candidatus Heimdallarchaeota archaeon]|nr:PHP domain-containing protein [Candidatus Heimdallarchaeota archaeon]